MEHRAGGLAHDESAVDLREGGKFLARMEAKDGSEGFDFEGTYTRIVPQKAIEYRMSDGREVKVEFVERADGVLVKETFDRKARTRPRCSGRDGRPSSTTSAGTWRRRPDRRLTSVGLAQTRRRGCTCGDHAPSNHDRASRPGIATQLQGGIPSWTLSSTPTLTIEDDGTPATQFVRIMGVARSVERSHRGRQFWRHQ